MRQLTPEQLAQRDAKRAEVAACLMWTREARDPGPNIRRQPGGVYASTLAELRERHPGVRFSTSPGD